MMKREASLAARQEWEQSTTQESSKHTSTDRELTLRLRFVIDILEKDTRPSFIVDRALPRPPSENDICIVHCNPALNRDAELGNALSKRNNHSQTDAVEYVAAKAFHQWVYVKFTESCSSNTHVETYEFFQIIWTTVSFNKLLVVSGLPRGCIPKHVPEHLNIQDNHSRAADQSKILAQLPPDHKSEDGPQVVVNDRNVAVLNDQPGATARTPASAHLDFFHSINWTSTELGAMETWSDELHQMCAFVMSDPEPAFLFWGEELIVIHNEPAIRFFPQVQSALMGSTIERVVPQIWASFGSIFAMVRNTMRVVGMHDIPVLLDRDGTLKEFYVSYRYIPLQNRAGKFLGIYETCLDVTKQNLSQRRLATLLEVSTCSTQVVDKKVFWHCLIQALGCNKEDVGYALLYSLDETPPADADLLKRHSYKSCILEGVLGISEDHISARDRLDLNQDEAGYGPSLKVALEKDAPVLIRVEDGTLPHDYVADVTCRGYSAPCHSAVVCPIRPTGGATVTGFLIMGLSSRVVYDDEMRQFIDILNRQIATSMASVTLFNEQLLREQRRIEEAALVHASLQERLEQKTRALLTSEAKFEKMTDSAPIGISITNIEGRIMYANDAWYKLLGHPGDDVSAESWISLLHEEDIPLAVKSFSELMTNKEDKAFEIRLKKEWIREIDGAEPIRMPTWVLASAYIVEEDENGQAMSLFGALTDISAQKWAEETHRRRMVEALELKSQQESFIDTISHEMRNPLSAVLQSVDEIAEYLSQKTSSVLVEAESRRSSIEAVETIMLCCQHQRRVIDDVLTLSKMNTDMLTITPDDNDPLQVVNNIIRIFSGDAKKQGISLSLEVEDSIRQMSITRLLFDASRLSQVLVNLLGNAIKFTRDSIVRKIKISAGTFAERPPRGDHGVDYVEPPSSSDRNVNLATDPTDGQVYLRIVVQDTGIGMTDAEKQRLFQRFAQASPRTYVQYGGSGLGLFISKKLSELQGGAIGLKMGSHQGTTFAFYVSASRSKASGTIPSLLESTESQSITLAATPIELSLRPMAMELQSKWSIANQSILVVEDNVVNQKVMCQQLRKKGCTVYSASHGAEALEFLESTRFWKDQHETGKPLSLVLLDIEMPVMDGLTCIRKIRQFEADGLLNAHVPVISVSANARREQVQDAKLAGMDDNISKPFRINDLIPIMESLLARTAVLNEYR